MSRHNEQTSTASPLRRTALSGSLTRTRGAMLHALPSPMLLTAFANPTYLSMIAQPFPPSPLSVISPAPSLSSRVRFSPDHAFEAPSPSAPSGQGATTGPEWPCRPCSSRDALISTAQHRSTQVGHSSFACAARKRGGITANV